ncbi:hypothetical protein GC163_05905 [bacterium]|nr:hypothetical protein [bacterium]
MTDTPVIKPPQYWRPQHHLAFVIAGLAIAGAIAMFYGEPDSPPVMASAPLAALTNPSQTDDTASSTSTKPAEPLPPVEQSSAAPVPASPTVDNRGLLIGSWSDEFYGHRVFTFKEDGTATMSLELDSVGKMLYGPKLTFRIQWSLKDNVLTMIMSGGEPANTTATLAKLFGETSEQRIESINETEMQLRSLDSQKLYTHKRVKTTPAASPMPPVTP